MTSTSLKIAIFVTCIILVLLPLGAIQSCGINKKSGDYYYNLAMESLAKDSIEDAFCQIDKAWYYYAQEKNYEKEGEARIILSMLYFSNNLKEKAYEIIKDLNISLDDTCNYLLKSNYFRIMAYYYSLVANDNEKALQYIDTVISNDLLIDENARNPHLIIDLLNKSEFLLNANRIADANELVMQIEKMAGNDTTFFPQLYINKARILDTCGATDSAYLYSNLVETTTNKIYKDADNLLAALLILMRVDSLNNNLEAYAAHRNQYESIVKEQIGDKARLKMELLSNKNKMELSELNYEHTYQLYAMWGVVCLCIFLLIILIIIAKYQNAKKQKQLIQLECEKLDAECFKRRLECELYTRKIEAKDEEMKKINQDLLDLSHQLLISNNYQTDNAESNKDYLSRLQQKVETEHPGFVKKIADQFPSISKTEMILAQLIRLNLNTEEITSLLNITQAGLIKSRYRLRKRLGIASSSELDPFIASL